MPGNVCIVCQNTKAKDGSASFHRFPQESAKRLRWIEALDLTSVVIKEYHRVCSRHFLDADARNDPQLNLGRHLASPMKKGTERNRRAVGRELRRASVTISQMQPNGHDELSVPDEQVVSISTDTLPKSMIANVGEQLITDYQVYEIPEEHIDSACETNTAAMLDQIKTLEKGNNELTKKLDFFTKEKVYFKITDIAENDKLVKLYTGFQSYEILLAFFEFLGPSVSNLTYWGEEKRKTPQKARKRSLDAIDQFFLTLMKLKLNLRNLDLAVRFGISESDVSKYITTWICFLYQHLNEIEWMPSPSQVAATLPDSFFKKYPSTFAIIDGSEVFIQTPSDLHLQASTWSQYKHHNTAKFLIACTPNGAISYISPLYVGSISDVELTRVSGFLKKLEGKNGISIMADKGFTIKDQLKEIGVDLNIPPFLDGGNQLSPDDVLKGRNIASLRIHVERAIRRIKSYSILKEEIPLSMIWLTNHIVSVCAWLTNFQPALVPAMTDLSDTDVDTYIQTLDDTDG